MAGRDIVVIGASAGGFEALRVLAGTLPADLAAAVFVVLHKYDQSDGILPALLNHAGPLLAANAVDGETIRKGRIYVAPPDYHVVLQRGCVQLSHGPKENLQRPCINMMFRSAAAAYRERVIGVLLTGLLDDGAAGLWEIQQHYGATVVQDPEEATFRSMPDSAIRGLNVQYIVRLAEMGPLLARLSVTDHNPSDPGEPLLPFEESSGQASKATRDRTSVEGVQRLRCATRRPIYKESSMKRHSEGLVNPVELNPTSGRDHVVQVIVETPKGHRNKFAFDPEQRIFSLSRVLPAGMVFPLDFGFLPKTKAPDGDPVDVLLIMDEPGYPGIAVEARVLGVLEGEQTEEDGAKTRNDRLLAVAEQSQTYTGISDLDKVPKVLLSEIEEFFANYHRIQGRQYKPLGWKDADAAMRNLARLRV